MNSYSNNFRKAESITLPVIHNVSPGKLNDHINYLFIALTGSSLITLITGYNEMIRARINIVIV
jgi:hypothetical protein